MIIHAYAGQNAAEQGSHDLAQLEQELSCQTSIAFFSERQVLDHFNTVPAAFMSRKTFWAKGFPKDVQHT